MRQQGFILVMAIWVAMLVLITGLSVIYMAQSNLDLAANLRGAAEVRALAQAGLEHGLLYVRAESEASAYPQTLQVNQNPYQYTVTVKQVPRPDEKRYEYEVRSTATGPRNSTHTAYQVLARMAGPPDQANRVVAGGQISLDSNLSMENFFGSDIALHSNTKFSASAAAFVASFAPFISISSAATTAGPYNLSASPPITLRNDITAEDPKAQIALTLDLYKPHDCTPLALSSAVTLYNQSDLDNLWISRGLPLNTCLHVPTDVNIRSAGTLNLAGRKLMVKNLDSDSGSILSLNNSTLYATEELSFNKINAHNSTLIAHDLLNFNDSTCNPSLGACTLTGTNVLISEADKVNLNAVVTPPGSDQVGLYVYGGKEVYMRTSSVSALVRAGTGGVELDNVGSFTGGIVTTGGVKAYGDLTLRKPSGFVVPGNPSPVPTTLRGKVEVLSRR
jgi:hypothetical protein